MSDTTVDSSISDEYPRQVEIQSSWGATLRSIIDKIGTTDPSGKPFLDLISESDEPTQVHIGELVVTLKCPDNVMGGKHKQVLLINIHNNDTNDNQEYVIKKDGNTVQEAEIERSVNPTIVKYIPAILGEYKGWIILEMLKGLEGKELIERVAQDEALLRRYIHAVSIFLQDISTDGLRLRDVGFSVCQNLIFNPETSTVKCIEITNVSHKEENNGDEELAKLLMEEIRYCSTPTDDYIDKSKVEDYKMRRRILMLVLRDIFSQYDDPSKHFALPGTYMTILANSPVVRQVIFSGRKDDETDRLIYEGIQMHRIYTIPGYCRSPLPSDQQSNLTQCFTREFVKYVLSGNIYMVQEILRHPEEAVELVGSDDERYRNPRER